jgi:uncharacterized protein YutD
VYIHCVCVYLCDICIYGCMYVCVSSKKEKQVVATRVKAARVAHVKADDSMFGL